MKHFTICAVLLAAVLLLPGCCCKRCCGKKSCDKSAESTAKQESVAKQESAPKKAAVAIVVTKDAAKVDTKATVERMEKLAQGIIMYTIDHDDNMPEKLADVATEGYVDDAVLVKDPVTGRDFGFVARTFQHTPIEKPAEFPMAFALYPQNGVAVVLYADKHVAEFRTSARTPAEFVEAMNAAHPYDADTIRVLRINARAK